MTVPPFTARGSVTRRRLLGAALASGAAVPLATLSGTAWAGPDGRARTPRRLTLPAPTGPYPVGAVPLHLVDRSRPDAGAGPAASGS
ncbi:hypothetical protein [Streptomyces albidoflavus]|uniref:hypothetical protein n=1 Tax=Streptomyces albidoflavus TaxID=1886 RepID=UPI0033B8355B